MDENAKGLTKLEMARNAVSEAALDWGLAIHRSERVAVGIASEDGGPGEDSAIAAFDAALKTFEAEVRKDERLTPAGRREGSDG